MRRVIVGVISAALLPLLLTGTSRGAASAAPAPDVTRVERAYGDGPVRLEARQGVDVAFRARRGDRVMLDVRSRTYPRSPCFGTQALVDGRGRSMAPLETISGTRIFRVRTTGRAMLSFRGVCSSGKGQTPHAVSAQLTKVRTREVQRNGRTSVREPRRGYVDIAYVRVAHDGRDTLTLRAPDGSLQEIRRGGVLVGNRVVRQIDAPAMSVEAGQRYVLDDYPSDYNTRLTSGQVVGIVAGESGYAESLQAREHRLALDDPAITLPAEPGREHVLIYETTPEDRAYVIPVGLPSQQAYLNDANLRWGTWRRYPGGPDHDNPSLQRTIVFSDREGADPQSQQVRVRRTVRVPDLVVGGAAVTFASADPGTRFVSKIPVSAAHTVRLTASNLSTTGPWETDVPPVFCSRDCLFTGLTVRPEELEADGVLRTGEPHELVFYFEPNATGSVTLALTDIP